MSLLIDAFCLFVSAFDELDAPQSMIQRPHLRVPCLFIAVSEGHGSSQSQKDMAREPDVSPPPAGSQALTACQV